MICLYSVLLVCLLKTQIFHCQANTKAVHEVCTQSTDCPARATCKPTSCDGYTCLCDYGYVANTDRRECIKAARISDRCDDHLTRCISEYAHCVNGTCSCLRGFQATKDGRCKLPGTSFIGETCGTCEFPATCTNGVCNCAGEFRSLTTEEFWVDPVSILQCRPKDYSLDMCNGTSILTTTGVAIETNIQNNDFTAPVFNSNDWSLILPEKSIYDSCNSHSQCPGNAKCRPNSCDGFVCLCDVGFLQSEDRLQCMPAVRTGKTCDPRVETCLSLFATCTTGICKCDAFFSPTIDGRCRVTKTRYIGESCRGSEECEYPGTCVNGYCACVEPQREITSEEFWIDPSLTIQCRPRDYSTWRCNRSVIEIPSQFQADIPIDVEIELTYKKAHKGHEHEDHVEVNPIIVVDQPEDEDDLYVPLQIAGILMASLFALLIACIFKTKRRKAIKRDISLTRTNILANKTMIAAEQEMVNNLHLRMEHAQPICHSPMHSPAMIHPQMIDIPQHQCQNTTLAIPRPNLSIYNKNGWHETYSDRSFYDNQTDIYPESNTTTRSTGPFIVDPVKHARVNSNVGDTRVTHSNGGVGIVAPYTINRNGPFIVDGHTQGSFRGCTIAEPQRIVGHYANESQDWHPECMSDHEPDHVMF